MKRYKLDNTKLRGVAEDDNGDFIAYDDVKVIKKENKTLALALNTIKYHEELADRKMSPTWKIANSALEMSELDEAPSLGDIKAKAVMGLIEAHSHSQSINGIAWRVIGEDDAINYADKLKEGMQ